jgi:hypothetical protein
MRVEHRLNATTQRLAVARNILGAETPYDAVPFWWSDQYDLRLQGYDLFGPEQQMAVVDGDPATGHFVAVQRDGGRIVAALGWNSPRELRRVQACIGDMQPAAVARD